MKYLISTTALSLAVCMTPTIAAANSYNSGYDAHEACKRGEDNRQLLGGLAGAVAGGIFGSQVSGTGARTEGSAIGAVLGGLAGAGIADKSIDCDPVYTTSSQDYAPTYNHASSYGNSQKQYEDQVTVSNHPVYADPNYGAGAVSHGQTYSAGTVTYPPSGNNSQYASATYSAPSYQAPTTYQAPAVSTRRYVSTPVTTTRSYVSSPITTTRQYVSAPVATSVYVHAQPNSQRAVYNVPAATGYVQHRPHKVSKLRKRRIARQSNHYHGSYSCDMGH